MSTTRTAAASSTLQNSRRSEPFSRKYAHVVSDPEGLTSPILLTAPVVQTIDDLTAEFGAPPPTEVQRKLVVSLIQWFSGQSAFKGTFKDMPEREQFLPDISEQLVVELYSK